MNISNENTSSICPYCGCAFNKNRYNQRYCSDNCRFGNTNRATRFCLICNKELPKGKQKYCSYECYRKNIQGKLRRKSRISISTGTMGAISECKVAADLLLRGFNVFRSVSPNSPCDLIALNNHHILRVEVKSAILSSNGQPHNIAIITDTNKVDLWALVTPHKIFYTPPISTFVDKGLKDNAK